MNRRFIENKALNSTAFNGMAYSGRSVALSGDGYVDVPLNLNIVDDASQNTTVVPVGNISASVNGTVTTLTCVDKGNTMAYGYQRLSYSSQPNALIRDVPAGLKYKITFMVRCSNPSNSEFYIFGWGGDEQYPSTTDWEEISIDDVISTSVNNDYLHYGFNDETQYGDTIEIDFSTMKIETVSDVHGQLTYFDFDQKKHISIGENGTELIENGDFSDGLNGWNEYNSRLSIPRPNVIRVQAQDSDDPYRWPAAAYVLPNYQKYIGRRLYWQSTNITCTVIKCEQYPEVAGHVPPPGANNRPCGTLTAVGSTASCEFDVQSQINGIKIQLKAQAINTRDDYAEFENIHMHEALPLSTHYRLKDITFNSLAILYDRSFTQADRDMMDASPELLVRWGLGEDVGFSIGVKGPNDKYYAVSEDGAYLLEVGYSEDVNILTEMGKAGATVTPVTNGWNIDAPAGIDGRVDFVTSGLDNNSIYRGKFDLLVNLQSFSEWTHYRPTMSQGYIMLPDAIPCENGNHRFILNNIDVADSIILYKSNSNPFNLDFTNVEVHKILSGYLTIEGTYTRNVNQPYGLQTLALKMNDAGVPTATADSNTLDFGTDYIEYVKNGNFSSEDGWVLSQGVIANNQLYCNVDPLADPQRVEKYASQQMALPIEVDKEYTLSFDVPRYDGGTLKVDVNGLGSISATTTGHFTQTFTATGGTGLINVSGASVYSGTVTNISVRQSFSPSVDDGYVDTKFKPSLPAYTIQDVVSGELAELDASGNPTGTTSQREEMRVLTHDNTEDKLYINGALQPYAPALPPSTEYIKLDNTAAIGYADIIKQEMLDYKVWTKALTQKEVIDNMNAWIQANRTIITDAGGNPLTDENGIYIYK